MYDNNEPIPLDNVRSLILELTFVLDRHFAALRKGTSYAGLRKSDIKVFVLASRQPSSMAALARDLAVSRQAVHDSVKRLAALDIVALVALPNNARDRVVTITERGKDAQAYARTNIAKLETTCSEILGKEEFELLKKMLGTLMLGLKQIPVAQSQVTGAISSSS